MNKANPKAYHVAPAIKNRLISHGFTETNKGDFTRIISGCRFSRRSLINHSFESFIKEWPAYAEKGDRKYWVH